MGWNETIQKLYQEQPQMTNADNGPQPAPDNGPAQNTDRHLWPIISKGDEPPADSLHVTADGQGIGINCGGRVIVKTMRGWHKADQNAELAAISMRIADAQIKEREIAGRALIEAILVRFPDMRDPKVVGLTDSGKQLIKAFQEFRALLDGA